MCLCFIFPSVDSFKPSTLNVEDPEHPCQKKKKTWSETYYKSTYRSLELTHNFQD